MRYTAIRIHSRNIERVLLDVVPVWMVQVTVVEIVHMVVMRDCDMTTFGTMFVRMIAVFVA